jgi:two-component system OmpR family response regulator
MRILVIDNDEETRELIGQALQRDGHIAVLLSSPIEARMALESQRFDVVVLDVMLDQASGLDLCAQLRSAGCATPILFVSARGTVHARVEGLDVGGDDYLPKPFALRELVARVRALGRRGPALHPRVLQFGMLTLDFDARRATALGRELPITSREWDVLRVLADANGRVVPFDDVLERVWGDATEGTRASMEVILSRMRKKLDAAAGHSVVRTARGCGYALEQGT